MYNIIHIDIGTYNILFMILIPSIYINIIYTHNINNLMVQARRLKKLYRLAAPRNYFFVSICRANTDRQVTKTCWLWASFGACRSSASICRANIAPHVTELRLWASFGACRSSLDRGSDTKTFFTKLEPKNQQENLHCFLRIL